MILKIGTYSFPANGVSIDRRIDTVLSNDNVPYSEKHVWNVSGELLGSTQSELIAANAALAKACGKQYQDLKFYADDGTTLAFALINAVSMDGVKIMNFRNPPIPGQFATAIGFEFTAEASYIYASNVTNPVLEYQETLTITGGGPRYGFVECVNAAPVKQLIIPQTVSLATQSGRATGLGAWPTVPGPLWPADELPDQRSITRESPQRDGAGFSMYQVSWTYQFAAVVVFNGQPRKSI